MQNDQNQSSSVGGVSRIRVKPWFVGLALAWTFCILISLGWNIHQQRLQVLEQARAELRANFFKDLGFRRWGAKHGGVYVPVTGETQPDPYMAHLPERDVSTPSGRILTLINPALMVKRFYQFVAHEGTGVHSHISGLNPLNPENRADAWEAQALELLVQGNKKEISEVAELDGQPYLRLIRPLYIGRSCLSCHAHQGYGLGDLSGGISVSVPLTALEEMASQQVRNLSMGHAFLWIIGLAGLGAGNQQLSRRILERERAETALHETEERSRIILSSALDAVIIVNEACRITDWSGQAEKIFGWSRQEAMGQSMTTLIVPEKHREAHCQEMRSYRDMGEGGLFNKSIEVDALHRDGREFPVEMSISAVTLAGKNHISVFLRDISERKHNEARIQRDYHSQRVIASVLEISLSAISLSEKLERTLDLVLSVPWLDLQAKGCIFLADTGSRKLVMQSQRGLPESLLSTCAQVEYGHCLCGRAAASGESVFTDHIDAWHDTHYDGIPQHGHYCIPIRYGKETIGVLNLYVAHGHVRNPDEERFLTSVSDSLAGMIKRHQAEKELERNAFFDQLTGLPNRVLLLERLEHSIQRLQRQHDEQSAVMFMDLDRFKNVNDSLGHTAGDRLLVEVGRRLERCIRPGDTVARLGGDEFTILLEEIEDATDALRVAGRVHAELAKPVVIDGHELFASASVGIVVTSPEHREAQELLRDADTAMYQAKTAGAGRTEVFNRSMHTRAVATLKMETDLRLAVENDRIQVQFQPIIHLPDKKVAGFEALAHWNHPQRGNIPPSEFIPVAEESGLIDAVAGQVLTKSCRQLAKWLEEHPDRTDLYVAVNLSAKQLLHPELAERIDGTLARYKLAPQNLRLEIPESVLMQNVDLLSTALKVFSDRGINLHLDDFGTGYSSLGHLHRFPFNSLKVDRSFVAKFSAAEEYAGLVRAIMAVAINFQMEIIAEGVETPVQLEQLRQLGCTIAQGFLFSPPVSGEHAGAWLSGQQAVSE